jgi:hypothetical protein
MTYVNSILSIFMLFCYVVNECVTKGGNKRE